MFQIFHKAVLTADISADNVTVITDQLSKKSISYTVQKKLCFDAPQRRKILQRSTELPIPSQKNQMPTYIIRVKRKDLSAGKEILKNLSFQS